MFLFLCPSDISTSNNHMAPSLFVAAHLTSHQPSPIVTHTHTQVSVLPYPFPQPPLYCMAILLHVHPRLFLTQAIEPSFFLKRPLGHTFHSPVAVFLLSLFSRAKHSLQQLLPPLPAHPILDFPWLALGRTPQSAASTAQGLLLPSFLLSHA